MKIISYTLIVFLMASLLSCGKKFFICSCFGNQFNLSHVTIFDHNNQPIYVDRVELYKFYEQNYLETLSPTQVSFPADTNPTYSILNAGTFFSKQNSPITFELRAIHNNTIVGKSIFRMMLTCCDIRVIEGNMNINTDL